MTDKSKVVLGEGSNVIVKGTNIEGVISYVEEGYVEITTRGGSELSFDSLDALEPATPNIWIRMSKENQHLRLPKEEETLIVGEAKVVFPVEVVRLAALKFYSNARLMEKAIEPAAGTEDAKKAKKDEPNWNKLDNEARLRNIASLIDMSESTLVHQFETGRLTLARYMVLFSQKMGPSMKESNAVLGTTEKRRRAA